MCNDFEELYYLRTIVEEVAFDRSKLPKLLEDVSGGGYVV